MDTFLEGQNLKIGLNEFYQIKVVIYGKSNDPLRLILFCHIYLWTILDTSRGGIWETSNLDSGIF